MRKFYTAEAVTEGHPDKLCDQIADAILDVCLKQDEQSRVACEVLATKGTIIVAGEITSTYEPDVFAVVRKVLSDVGYSSEGIAMDTFVHRQSPDIAGAVDTSKERREGVSDNQIDWFQGAGDQGVMIGYACDETKQLMPMPVVLANRIVRELSACRQSSYIQGILPDGKAQVTVEYENGKPVRLDSVVVSCQHTEDKNLKKLEAEIRKKVLLPALRLLPPDEDTKIFINPSGRFVCGGMDADTGLTGRKLMVDSYGSMVPHGGGAFSGKDCSKVDRSATYMARYIAKNIVAAGLASKETIFARIHHRLVRLYNILQESNRKVEAERQELQSLVSDISHQVRTPVSNMKMIVDTLLTKPLEEQERNEFLKSVRGQINKLDFLIQALVKTSRLETGVIQLEKEEHFLYDTLAQAMSGILYSAEQKKIHVSVECPEDLCVSHDSKWTEEAIFNLLDNAVKYTPTGGHVNVSVAQWEMYVEIKVSDTGKGISESNQASIFKRFYREEEIHNQPGVGIGLYLTREIVTQQGGYVTVESQVGKGSAFSIFLPR